MLSEFGLQEAPCDLMCVPRTRKMFFRLHGGAKVSKYVKGNTSLRLTNRPLSEMGRAFTTAPREQGRRSYRAPSLRHLSRDLPTANAFSCSYRCLLGLLRDASSEGRELHMIKRRFSMSTWDGAWVPLVPLPRTCLILASNNEPPSQLIIASFKEVNIKKDSPM